MAFGVVSASQIDEEHTLTGTASWSALGSDGVSVFEEASGLVSATLRGWMSPLPSILMRPKVQSLLRHPKLMSLHWFLTSLIGGASMVCIRSTGTPRCWTIKWWWLSWWMWSGEFLKGVYIQSLMCISYLPATNLSGWLGVWVHIVSRLCECSTHHSWRLSEVFWKDEWNLSNRTHSQRF